MSEAVQALSEGARVSDYRIVRSLGADRFGFLYQGVGPDGSSDLVIREFFPRAVTCRQSGAVVCNEEYRDGFERALKRLERLTAKLRQFLHPNFARIVDFKRAHGTGYVVQSGCTGETLEAWLHARTAPCGLDELRPIIDPVLDALSSMNRLGGVHQDVSSLTIVMHPDGRPMLAGAAALSEAVGMTKVRAPDLSEITPASLNYLAPEQFTGTIGLGPRTDVYAAGAVLYRALVGRPPIVAVRRMEVTRFGDDDPYEPIDRATRAPLPLRAASAIDRSLSLRVKDRLQSIDELRAALCWIEPPIFGAQPQRTTASHAARYSAEPKTQSVSRPSSNLLTMTELAERRAQLAVLPDVPNGMLGTAYTSAQSESETLPPNRRAHKHWLGSIAMVAAAGAAAVGIGGTQMRFQMRFPGHDQPVADEVSVIGGTVLVVLAAIAGLWAARRPLRNVYSALKERHLARRNQAVQSPVPNTQAVDISAFAPLSAAAGGRALIQLYLHAPNQSDVALQQAREADPVAARRGVRTLAVELAIGQALHVALEAPGLRIDEPVQSLAWNGKPCSCQFLVRLPRNAAGKNFYLRARVAIDAAPIGVLQFKLSAVAREQADSSPQICGDQSHRYRYAFLSYASPDRAEVLKRAQMLNAAKIDFFHDLLKLEPGERWERRLYKEIERCDLFLLYWSRHAAASEWVIKEATYALGRTERSSLPHIYPIILAQPVPVPPDALKTIHFNDPLSYIIAAVESRPSAALPSRTPRSGSSARLSSGSKAYR